MSEDWDARYRDLLATPRWERLAEQIGAEKCEELLDLAVPVVVWTAGRTGRPLDEQRFAEALGEAYEWLGLGTLENVQTDMLAREALTSALLLVGETLMKQRPPLDEQDG